jgi:hypothetical protein
MMALMLPCNTMVTSMGLLYIMCSEWVAEHPEDGGMDLSPLVRKILGKFAVANGGTMVVYGNGEAVSSYGMLTRMPPNG